MEKPTSPSGNLWLPYVLMLVLMAVGVSNGPKGTSIVRPGTAEGGLSQAILERQTIPARLWQDPLEATETARRILNSGDSQSPAAQAAFADSISITDLIGLHARKDGALRADGTTDYLTNSHRVLFQFVSLPSESYPEAGEQSIRTR